jgi:hypothetical protein
MLTATKRGRMRFSFKEILAGMAYAVIAAAAFGHGA